MVVIAHLAPDPPNAVEIIRAPFETAGAEVAAQDLAAGSPAVASAPADGGATVYAGIVVGSNAWFITCVASLPDTAEECAAEAIAHQAAYAETLPVARSTQATAPEDDLFMWSRIVGQITGGLILGILVLVAGKAYLSRRPSGTLGDL